MQMEERKNVKFNNSLVYKISFSSNLITYRYQSKTVLQNSEDEERFAGNFLRKYQ